MLLLPFKGVCFFIYCNQPGNSFPNCRVFVDAPHFVAPDFASLLVVALHFASTHYAEAPLLSFRAAPKTG